LALEKVYQSNDQCLIGLKDPPVLALPFGLAQFDNDVCAQVYAITHRLPGRMQSATKMLEYLCFSCLAKTIDSVIENLAQGHRQL